MLTETITWRPVSPDDMPDADLLVNVAIDGGEEPVWLGAYDGAAWRDTEGMEITVTHWAPMLVGPAGVRAPAPTLLQCVVLRDVVRCLRESGRYVDEEGEATQALDDLAQTLAALGVGGRDA